VRGVITHQRSSGRRFDGPIDRRRPSATCNPPPPLTARRKVDMDRPWGCAPRASAPASPRAANAVRCRPGRRQTRHGAAAHGGAGTGRITRAAGRARPARRRSRRRRRTTAAG
jgi:hypothetical protein